MSLVPSWITEIQQTCHLLLSRSVLSSHFIYHMLLVVQLSRIQRPRHFWQLHRSEVFPVWFYSRPNKAKSCAKVEAFCIRCLPHNHCHFYSSWLKFSCVKRATNEMGGLVCLVFSSYNATNSFILPTVSLSSHPSSK